LALEPVLRNVQVSWVKMGREGAAEALCAGANDFGGVLMNESITRAAGGRNGQRGQDGCAFDVQVLHAVPPEYAFEPLIKMGCEALVKARLRQPPSHRRTPTASYWPTAYKTLE
jgi:hypothetical protein